ncbi:hypothetical protein PG996_007324 [Apiospora saccharicola]|uniref:Uncharacterized protein n=1 Tax=Apiospora saccharicola TaxID=335842 RepID=A0ABR1VBD2_9PEZI
MPANEQHAVKSPAPSTSQACLGLAAVELTALVIARHYREQPAAGFFGAFFWAKFIGVVTSLILLLAHGYLRYDSYDKEHHGKFHRALPLCSGLVTVCAMTIFNTLFWSEGFSTCLLAYQAEMWFWIGYWVEWWTALLGDALVEFGC